MKKSYVTAVLTLTCLLGIGVSARAQDADAVVVSVPFEFVAGGATLPAGEYRVSRLNPGISRELSISSYKNGGAFLLPTTFGEFATANGHPTLSFEVVGGKHFLTGIKTLSGVYTLPASREMVMLAKGTSPNPGASSASGGQ